jgi:hypothetical protein
MQFGADGQLWGDPISFTAKRIDREETAAFRQAIKDSGFVGVFPVLYEAAAIPETGWLSRTKEKMCDAHEADQWPEIVSHTKYPTYYARAQNKPQYEDHKAALKALIARHVRDMTKLVNTDVTVL